MKPTEQKSERESKSEVAAAGDAEAATAH